MPLSYDEAYYWIWTHYPQLSYYDHPPFIMWLIKIGNFLYTPDLPQIIRLPGILLSHLTFLIWIYIGKKWLDNRMLIVFSFLYLSFPLIGLGGIIQTPDNPLLFFWALSFYFFINLLNRIHYWDYLLLGLTLGLGFTSKYHMALFGISGLLYLSIYKQWGKISFKYVPLTILFFIIGSLPVWLWNFSNDFQSIRFQLDHGLGGQKYDFKWTMDYLLGQIFILSPALLFITTNSFIKDKNHNKLLIYFFATSFLFFLITSFKGHVEANWPITGMTAYLMLVAIYSHKKKKIINGHIVFWCLVSLSLLLTIKLVPAKAPINPVTTLFRYEEYKEIPHKFYPLYTTRYQSASMLWIYSGKPVYKLANTSRFDLFDTLTNSNPSEKEFYLLIDFDMPLDESKFINYELENVFQTDLITIYKVNKRG